ncbi:hypothetical protein HPP92_017070 [Vanilla planifolia]|uniref:Uncharacterized protein n=1 Tax=Vanilla planifolia TaxID=51239 RepID=A0A835QHC7_VANPL|nr:hypothetical protein HPP92_017070 [Vanilla planifolia]
MNLILRKNNIFPSSLIFFPSRIDEKLENIVIVGRRTSDFAVPSQALTVIDGKTVICGVLEVDGGFQVGQPLRARGFKLTRLSGSGWEGIPKGSWKVADCNVIDGNTLLREDVRL